MRMLFEKVKEGKQNSVSKVGNSYRMPFPENIILYLRR